MISPENSLAVYFYADNMNIPEVYHTIKIGMNPSI